jgi:hypothetical protein
MQRLTFSRKAIAALVAALLVVVYELADKRGILKRLGQAS